MRYDVAIVGGGPAGLACSIEAALRGFSAVVIERRAIPCDKACGEGILPPGVRALEELGVLPLIPPDERAVLEGIRYVESDGSSADGRLPGGGGLGVRRVVLAAAMAKRAGDLGVDLRDRCEALGPSRTALGFSIETARGRIEAGLLVAADGLASPLRRAEGLDVIERGPKRFGARRHFCTPHSQRFVEVHFAERAEAYLTPIGRDRLGVAMLWEPDKTVGPTSFEALLSLFPAIESRLRGAEVDSSVRGAGPLRRGAKRRVADRFVLIGDAAGYIDAITGEGLSLALTCARALGEILPAALAAGATARSLAPYERAFTRAFRRYAWLTNTLLALTRRPMLRRNIVHLLRRRPALFDLVLATAIG